MRSSRKTTPIAVTAALALVAGAMAQKPEKPGKPDKGEKGKKGKKEEASDELNLPIPKGQPQKGVKVPLYNTQGQLKMRFTIGIGTWMDEDNVKMERLRVETFDEKGKPEMDMDLPDAVLNKKTKDISSDVQVHIKRADFEITGNNMKFNMETRQGTLGGGVKMLIYDTSGDTAPADDKPSVEFAPKKEEPQKEEPKKEEPKK